MTLRDDVWTEVLKELVKNGEVTVTDLPFDESKRHTVRRTLKQMEENGWLERENERDPTWELGELAKLHLDIDDDPVDEA